MLGEALARDGAAALLEGGGWSGDKTALRDGLDTEVCTITRIQAQDLSQAVFDEK